MFFFFFFSDTFDSNYCLCILRITGGQDISDDLECEGLFDKNIFSLVLNHKLTAIYNKRLNKNILLISVNQGFEPDETMENNDPQINNEDVGKNQQNS